MDDISTAAAARVACPACKLLGPPISPAWAAQELAGIHDDFQHRGRATAIVRVTSTSASVEPVAA
jgi:hypothetical protein